MKWLNAFLANLFSFKFLPPWAFTLSPLVDILLFVFGSRIRALKSNWANFLIQNRYVLLDLPSCSPLLELAANWRQRYCV
jgi:hypothetical protein